MGENVMFRRFDAAEYLDSDEVIAEFLAAALEDEDLDVFVAALGEVAKARDMTQIAAAGLGRGSLYKALTAGSKLPTRPCARCWRRSASGSRCRLGEAGARLSGALRRDTPRAPDAPQRGAQRRDAVQSRGLARDVVAAAMT